MEMGNEKNIVCTSNIGIASETQNKSRIPQKGIDVFPQENIGSQDFDSENWLAMDENADFEQLIFNFIEDYRLAQKFERLYVESK